MKKRYTLLNDLLFKKLFTSESNQYILLQFINDITNLNFTDIILNETYRIDTYAEKLSQYNGELFETIVDLSGKLSDGTVISIELQVKNHYKFIERSLYYTANTFVNQYTKQRKYATLNPVISINIINFPLYSFKESTLETFVFKNIDNQPLLNDRQQSLFTIIYFSLVNETKSTLLNYWRKLFLNLDIDDNAPKVIKDANKIIDFYQLSEAEKMLITKEEKIRADFEFIRDYELSESRKTGEEIGKQAGILETAKNMLLKNLDVSLISEVTGLSIDEIKNINI